MSVVRDKAVRKLKQLKRKRKLEKLSKDKDCEDELSSVEISQESSSVEDQLSKKPKVEGKAWRIYVNAEENKNSYIELEFRRSS